MEPGHFVRVRVRKSTLNLTLNADENWKCHALDLKCRFTEYLYSKLILVLRSTFRICKGLCRSRGGGWVGWDGGDDKGSS